MEDISWVVSILSFGISFTSFVYSIIIQNSLKRLTAKQLTVSAFNMLQEQVLDKLIFCNKENAQMIVENMDIPDCRDAYKEYKVLIARLEHFAVGVNQGVYDFEVVYQLAGEHLVYLYKDIKPIIIKANEHTGNQQKFYCEYVKLVDKLNKRINKTKKGENS